MLLPLGRGLPREDQGDLEDTTITLKSYILKPDRLDVVVWECILYADTMLYRECKECFARSYMIDLEIVLYIFSLSIVDQL